jgi:hypothetical protein
VFARRAVQLKPLNLHPWSTLGVACFHASKWVDAIAALEKHLALAESTPEPEMKHRRRPESLIWFYLASAHAHIGQRERGLDCFKKGVACMEQNLRKFEKLSRFRVEAAELLGVNGKK